MYKELMIIISIAVLIAVLALTGMKQLDEAMLVVFAITITVIIYAVNFISKRRRDGK